jgi:hypothetical protein
MKYIDYINLGFERIETDDNVEFNETGNKSFVLSFKVDKHLHIEMPMGWPPTLYYRHKKVCELSVEQVKEMTNRKFDLNEKL